MSVVRLPVSGEKWKAFKNTTRGQNLGISIQSFKHFFILQQVATSVVQTPLECSKAACVSDERYPCVSASSSCYQRDVNESKSALSSLAVAGSFSGMLTEEQTRSLRVNSPSQAGRSRRGAAGGQGEHEPAVHPWGSGCKLQRQRQLGPPVPSLPLAGTPKHPAALLPPALLLQDGKERSWSRAGLAHSPPRDGSVTARLLSDTGGGSVVTRRSRDGYNQTHTTRISVGRPARHWHRPWRC